MTSRERVKRTLARERPDRLPFNFWMDRQRMEEFDALFGENFRVSHYGADVIEVFPAFNWFPELAARMRYETNGAMSRLIVPAVTAAAELRDAPMPDVSAETVCAPVKTVRAQYPDKALFALTLHPLEALTNLFGMEAFYCAVADDADIIEETIWRMGETLGQGIDALCAGADIDVLYLAGDICSTRGPLLSNEMLERFCFAPLASAIAAAHRHGIKVFFHTDGKVDEIMPLIIKAGIDGINPLQASCNDVAAFARDYGDRLMVYGGLDNLFIIPDGSLADIRAHVRRQFETLGLRGGYIASSHDIPYSITVERINVLVDALTRCL
ncbi:MAG: hypothetical protein FWF84_04050, partial [Kiritimatiellaeota bacterium]|nr:hypothetical protein [Kiritimatiellota bacterium]